MDPRFAESPEHYVRAFLIILKGLRDLFDYVEPTDEHMECYSNKILALLVRTCIEFEANCKAILKENGYQRGKPKDWNMLDYNKIERTHRLSEYKVKIPYWLGEHSVRQPFNNWGSGYDVDGQANQSISWYNAYNNAKHDRHLQFREASFGHLIDACCRLLVILSAQLWTYDFTSAPMAITWDSTRPNDGMEAGIGQYFLVKFPDAWSEDDQYCFNWDNLKTRADSFQTFDYSQIS